MNLIGLLFVFVFSSRFQASQLKRVEPVNDLFLRLLLGLVYLLLL
jgi:hypothetical protein